MFSHSVLIDLFKKRIPKLVSDLHKGQSGRIGIVGGSKEFVLF
jgi:NAD(P)H-hydrate repair Nnr-like enzyme with NAD(P)H-hydrate dehydratase domain